MINPPCYSKLNYWDYFNQISFKGKEILDIGSSLGSFNKTPKFEDIKEKLSEAKNYLTLDINSEAKPDIVADAHRLPFENNTFDIIIANNVIEHLYNPIQAVSEMYRVLKPEGTLYFTIPFMYPIHESPHDYSRFTRFGLENLFAKFKGLEIHERGGYYSSLINLFYFQFRMLDKYKLGECFRAIFYVPAYLMVKIDKFEKSGAFPRIYFGKMNK